VSAGPAAAPGRAAFQPTNRVEAVQGRRRELTPQTEVQRQLIMEANQIAGDLAQGCGLPREEAQSELPLPRLVILICWLTVTVRHRGRSGTQRRAP